MDECVRSADREDFTADIIAPPTTHFTWNCRSIWFRTTSSVDTFSRSVDFNIILYFKVGLEHRSELLAVFGNYPPLSGLCSQLVISRRTFSHHYHLGILGLHTPHIKCELRRVGPRWVVRGLPVDVARSGLPGTIVVGLPRGLVVYVLGIEAGAAAGESVVRQLHANNPRKLFATLLKAASSESTFSFHCTWRSLISPPIKTATKRKYANHTSLGPSLQAVTHRHNGQRNTIGRGPLPACMAIPGRTSV